MDNNVSSFFNHRNTIQNISESDHSQKLDYLEPIKAFARTTNKSLYVINYDSQGFEYVSDSPLFLCGNTSEEVLQMGYSFYFKHVPKADLDLLLKINEIGFEFYETVPLEDRKKYTISYDFNLISSEGKNILINQKLTPFFLNNEGKVWKALCIVSLSSNKTSGNIQVTKQGEMEIQNYDLTRNEWDKQKITPLSNREVEVLQLSIKGYTMNEIADLICLSVDSVKFHRKKLFEKLDVINISEAIALAADKKLI